MKAGNRLSLLVTREPLLFTALFAFTVWMAVMLPLYFYTNHREEWLDRHGVTTSGTVVSAERACSGDECQSVEVSYVVEGERYLLETNTGPNHPRADAGLSVGQSVEVRYDPADPETARLLTLGASEAWLFCFMTFFGLIVLGLPTAFLVVKRLLRPPEPLPEMPAQRAYPERAGGRTKRHDAHRLPEDGVVLVPSPMLPIAFVSGFGLLAVSLLVMLTVDEDPRTLLVRCALLFAIWPPLPALVYFGSSRSLRAGAGWLATKRGWRWHVIHTEELVEAPAGSVLDALFGQGHILRLYSASTRIDISEQQLACPAVHSALQAFVGQASGLSPEGRIVALRALAAVEPDPSKNLGTLVRKMWMLSGLLAAISVVEMVLLLALRG